MSIAVTELNEFGIVMVTDTALTEQITDEESTQRFGRRSRVLFGARKLFAHPKSRSGLAIYGAGQLPGPVASQFVIEKFLDDHAGYESTAKLSEELRVILHAFMDPAPLPLAFRLPAWRAFSSSYFRACTK